MRVKNAKKASSELQKMQTTLSRNCCSKNAPKLSAVIHCLQWITAKIALKMQWDFGHSGNLQNLQGNYLQCSSHYASHALSAYGCAKPATYTETRGYSRRRALSESRVLDVSL